MQIKVTVHSHDHLPEHEQVHFNTPEIPGGLLIVRLPKDSALPDIGSEFVAFFERPRAATDQAQQVGSAEADAGTITGGPVNTEPSDTSSSQLIGDTALQGGAPLAEDPPAADGGQFSD